VTHLHIGVPIKTLFQRFTSPLVKNWRGITLLSVVGKILGWIVIDQIQNGVDIRLRNEQAGYRKGRATTEQIFILRNIIEQANEWQASLYINFIDFEKAVDSIYHESLWLIMRKYRMPNKIVRMVKVFYEDFNCAVEDQAEACQWFNIKLKQASSKDAICLDFYS